MIVAILIGRVGSSGLPGKNTRELEGHPMCWWPLKAAAECASVDQIFVSTDDPLIMAVASEFKAKIIERPQQLATKEALGDHVFRHAHGVVTEALGESPELYVLLMANAVTVTPLQLEEGITALRSQPTLDSAVTVSKYNMWSPLRARRVNMAGLLRPFAALESVGNPDSLNCDRDSQGDVWFADMGASIVRPENLDRLEHGLSPQRWMGREIFPIENVGGLDVDYEFQLPQASWWLRKFRIEHCR